DPTDINPFALFPADMFEKKTDQEEKRKGPLPSLPPKQSVWAGTSDLSYAFTKHSFTDGSAHSSNIDTDSMWSQHDSVTKESTRKSECEPSNFPPRNVFSITEEQQIECKVY